MAKNRNRLKKISSSQTPNFRVRDPDGSRDDAQPIFSFKYMEYNKKHCISQCSQEDKAAIIGKLVRLSQFTWKQIATFPKNGHGFEPIPRDQFIVHLPRYVTPDVDKLQVLQYSEVGRLAGSRDRDVFHVLVVGDHIYRH